MTKDVALWWSDWAKLLLLVLGSIALSAILAAVGIWELDRFYSAVNGDLVDLVCAIAFALCAVCFALAALFLIGVMAFVALSSILIGFFRDSFDTRDIMSNTQRAIYG